MAKLSHGGFEQGLLIGMALVFRVVTYPVIAGAHCGDHAGTCDEWVALDEFDGYCEEPANPREFGIWWQNGEIKSRWRVTTDAVKNESGEIIKAQTCAFAWTCDPANGDKDCWRVEGAIGGICNPSTLRCLCTTATCTVCGKEREKFSEPQECLSRPPIGYEYRPFEKDPRCRPRVPCEGPREGGIWPNHGHYMRELAQVLQE